MPFGLVLSFMFHAALIGWALVSMRSITELTPDTPAISADIISPSEFLRLKQGSEDAKNLETKAKDEPTPDDSKNDTKKPNNAPPPPPPPSEQEVAKVEPPPEPEPPKPEPETAPGPTADEKKLLEQKIEEERRADEAKKAEAEAKQKAEADAKQQAEDEAKEKAAEETKQAAEEAKKKAQEEAKKKAAAEARKKAEAAKKKAAELKKKKQEEARKKAEAAKKQFDPSRIAALLEKSPEDAKPKALLDKDPRKKGQQASGSKADANTFGEEAGTATGADTVLSAREQDLLKGMLKSQLNGCWRPPGTGGGSDIPVVVLHWELNPDGTIAGEPRVTSAPSTAAGQVYTEAALRAVRMCSPFRLPPDKYEGGWRYIDWTFDPREML